MSSMKQLEKLAKNLATARAKAHNAYSEAFDAMAVVKEQHADNLSKLNLAVEKAQTAMLAALKQSESEFVDVKSKVSDGIKFGFRITRESIEASETTVQKLEKLKSNAKWLAAVPNAEKLLIQTSKPDLLALKGLSDQQLERIDAKRVASSNDAFIKAADGSLETLMGSVGAL